MAAGEQEIAFPMKHDIIEVEPGVYSILIGNRSHEVRVDGDLAESAGVPLPLAEEILNSGRSANGPAKVTAPMPGKIIRLLAAEGDPVEAGQGIVVVEAMKMQNEMKAPRSGVLKSLRAAAGSTVNAGELLALIE